MNDHDIEDWAHVAGHRVKILKDWLNADTPISNVSRKRALTWGVFITGVTGVNSRSPVVRAVAFFKGSHELGKVELRASRMRCRRCRAVPCLTFSRTDNCRADTPLRLPSTRNRAIGYLRMVVLNVHFDVMSRSTFSSRRTLAWQPERG